MPDPWRKLIDAALPQRNLKFKRDVVIDAVDNEVKRWSELEPEIDPHAEKVRELVTIADDLEATVNKALRALGELGVDKEIEKAVADRIAVGIDPHKAGLALAGASVTIDLYLVAARAFERLRTWNRIHRPPQGRPLEFAASLTKNLQFLLCRQIGCTAEEFESFLDVFNDNGSLPKLSTATLKKRKNRAKQKSR